jgi:DNA-3-methyladenine glycosylase II
MMTMSKNSISATLEAREFLSHADPVIGAVIAKYEPIQYELQTKYFESLISTIVGQQLSGKVADVIWARFEKLLDGDITPEKVLETDSESIRAIGISYNKIQYIKNIAIASTSRAIALDRFDDMTNDEIIEQLSAVKGIGAWTAEMFLIFSLGREDVFSQGDGGLARAINNLYGNGIELTAKERLKITEGWQPYRSIASLYLWRSLDSK